MDENAKMAESDQINLFHDALDFGLEILSVADLQLKEKQYDVVKCVVLDNKDVLAVLPTGYGKSLIYQLLPPVFNFMARGGKPEGEKSAVIVISPFNALIRDQIVKMRVGGLSVCVLRGDRVATKDDNDEISIDAPTEMLSGDHFDLIFTHPEVLVENKNVSKLLNPLNPGAFCQKGVSWTFWCFLGSISVKLPLIRSKMPLHHNSLAFLPLVWQCATFCLGHAQKSKLSLGFTIFDIFFGLSFFSFSFLFAAVIDLLLSLLAVKKTFRKASSRWATFTMEQPGVVAANLGLRFSLHFLSIFVHISGSIRPITLIWALLERSSSPSEVEHR